MQIPFQRVAIANRGESAMRLIHAIREYNLEHGTEIRTLALYTDPDEAAMFVREADEAISLGLAMYLDAEEDDPKTRYFDYDRLKEALKSSNADALWAGWGRAAVDPRIPELCEQMGIIYTGPDGETIRKLGDKQTSTQLAADIGIPVIPAGSKAIKKGRRMEVQIMADRFGTVWALGVCDRSIQLERRNVLAETPSPILNKEQTRLICAEAVKWVKAAHYHNAGIVGFLLDPKNGRFYFTDFTARLDAGHPITELTTGLDLVKLQIHVSAGGKLEGTPPEPVGHAMEIRLTAEDPNNQFEPSPGKISALKLATGSGIRIDTGFSEGDDVLSDFDPLIAQIMAFGRTREQALARLKRALLNTTSIVQGGITNKGFLLNLLSTEEIATADYDTKWLDRFFKKRQHLSGKYAEIALLQAAIEAYLSELEIDKSKFFQSAKRGRPEVKDESKSRIVLNLGGNRYELEVFRRGIQHFQMDIDGHSIEVFATVLKNLEWRLEVRGKQYRTFSLKQGLDHLIEVNGVPHRIRRAESGGVRAPSPAVVSRISVGLGDKVKRGERLLVLETMKMESSVLAAFPGTVKEIYVRDSMQVDAGTLLIELEPSVNGKVEQVFPRLDFAGMAMQPHEDLDESAHRQHVLNTMNYVMLGFDTDKDSLINLISEQARMGAAMRDYDPFAWEKEDEVLNIFADIISLFRREPSDYELNDGGRLSSKGYLYNFLLDLKTGKKAVPEGFLTKLRRATAHYKLDEPEPGKKLELSLFRIFKSHKRMSMQVPLIMNILGRRLEVAQEMASHVNIGFRQLLGRIIRETHGRFPNVHDLAMEVQYEYFEQGLLQTVRNQELEKVEVHLFSLAQDPASPNRQKHIDQLVTCPQALKGVLSNHFADANSEMRRTILEVMTRRYYRIRDLENIHHESVCDMGILTAEYTYQQKRIHVSSLHCDSAHFSDCAQNVSQWVASQPEEHDVLIDFYVRQTDSAPDPDALMESFRTQLDQTSFPRHIRRVVVSTSKPVAQVGMGGVNHFTYRQHETGFEEEKAYRGLHPMMAKRLELWRLNRFDIESIPAVEDIYLFKAVAKENPKDHRLIACAEVRDLSLTDQQGNKTIRIPYLEMMLYEAISQIRKQLAGMPVYKRPYWNRILLYIWPVLSFDREEIDQIISKLAPITAGLGLEKIVVKARIQPVEQKHPEQVIIEFINQIDSGWVTTYLPSHEEPIEPLTPYQQKVVRMERRGIIYPYELIKLLTPESAEQSEFPAGDFREYDLDEDGKLVPVDRPYGENTANIVVGLIRNYTPKYSEGMTRVAILSDPTRGMGNLAEAECRRINGALDLAEEMDLPVEWFAVSAGAKISMNSGTENMDWISLTLRRIIEFTQRGFELNIIVTGINVGGQPYWNAEATMLMHTKGILIMTPDVSMVLTGKQALDYSGGISADDNFGIGGYEGIMGPNGQAQYFAQNIRESCEILFRHYDHTYRIPEERFPRRAKSEDPIDRDVKTDREGAIVQAVADIFSQETNPDRKTPFDIRTLMRAVVDQDCEPLERWQGMKDAEIAVVWDVHLGGYPVCMIGIESRPIPRLGFIPADGPEVWTGGTLFPMASKKIARAVNAASDNRPLVVIANLSGFDGSPESLRKCQLEFGAEIGRSVTNFQGPIVLCVVSRYHGGAFVVFSNKLNDNMEVVAIEGAYASVIGGAPAAAVVFAREVGNRTKKDPAILALQEKLAAARGTEKGALKAQWNELYAATYSRKLGEVADEFESIHNIQRAREVGSVDHIIPPTQMRPHLIKTIERGMKKVLKPALNA